MHLQIKLSVPLGRTAQLLGIAVKVCLDLIVIGGCRLHLQFRKSRNSVLHSAVVLQHLSGSSAAAVAVAKGQKGAIRQALVLKNLPGSLQHIIRLQHTDIAFDKRSEDLGAVKSLPQKDIMRHGICLVPGNLGGKEPINTALSEDLRQCGIIAEHVRQPEHPALYAEFLFHKPLSVKDLAHQALAAGQVTVGLQPHRALDLPAPLYHALLDLPVQIRVGLLDVLIQLRLAGHKLVFRVLPHQIQHGCKAALRLFSGLRHRPQPGNIDMGMSDAADDAVTVTAKLFIKFLFEISARHLDALIKVPGIKVAEIKA